MDNLERGMSIKGPPEAVIIILSTSWVVLSSGRHWNIALCSLSIGIIVEPLDLAKGISMSPAATILSLFAINTVLPAFTAIRLALRPAKPTIADITISTLSSEIKFNNSWSEFKIFLSGLEEEISSYAMTSSTKTYLGKNFFIMPLVFLIFFPTAIPKRLSVLSFCLITLRTLSPILPVAPNKRIFFI